MSNATRESSSSERLFEDFLESWHSGDHSSIDQLCERHPRHAPQFRRWWQHLVAAGEISETPQSNEEQQALGSYRILHEIGHGAQGTVYLAEHKALRRRVALKVLPERRALTRQARARLAREAEITSRIDHPGVCTIYEWGVEGGTAYLAMRYVEGESLAARLARSKSEGRRMVGTNGLRGVGGGTQSDIDRLLLFFADIADALEAAHAQGLVHRDVKPGNIMITTDGRPVVLDFGLARSNDDVEALTLTGDLIGTPAYMSPEQLTAQRIGLDCRTDVWSLAVVLYECLWLQRPFDGPTREALYQQILAAEARIPPPSAKASRDLRAVLATALEKNRDRRYRSAEAFGDDLRRIVAHEPVRARRQTLLLRLEKFIRRKPTLAVSVAIGFLSLVIGMTLVTAAWQRTHDANLRYEQLADLVLVTQAIEDADALYPAREERIPAFEAWLRYRADPLLARYDERRHALEALREKALPYDEAERVLDRTTHPDQQRLTQLYANLEAFERVENASRNPVMSASAELRIAKANAMIDSIEATLEERRTWRFEDRLDRFLHDRLSELVQALDKLRATKGHVEQRLDIARSIRQRSIDEHEAAWQETIQEVRKSDTYGQRELRPQVGLVPLGADPRSGLFEFADATTGAVPSRNSEQQLVLDEASAIVFVLIPSGTFLMGAQSRQPKLPGFDPNAERFEGPPHEVSLDWFFIAKHELSQAQWARMTGGDRPSILDPDLFDGVTAFHPVTNVNWDRCEQVLARSLFELPSERQWEYAARGGTTTPYPYETFEDAANTRGRSTPKSGLRTRQSYDGYPLTAPIDALRPNGFGLHNVCGNVFEWCRDSWTGQLGYEAPSDSTDEPRDSADVGVRILRGGSYSALPAKGRSAARSALRRQIDRHDIGVRPVRRVEP